MEVSGPSAHMFRVNSLGRPHGYTRSTSEDVGTPSRLPKTWVHPLNL